MASSLPIPIPPRTPTPPSPTPGETESMEVEHDPNALSPMILDTQLASSLNNINEPSTATTSHYSPLSSRKNSSASAGNSARTEDGSGPFNFETTALAKSPVMKSVRFIPAARFSPSARIYTPGNPSSTSANIQITQNIGQRRGHKYKHSSVSHQIFQEPRPRAPLAVPNSLPQPTLAEWRASMTTYQTIRFWWSICHMAVAGYTAWNSKGSAAMQALSHLIFYDSLGALICVAVEVLGNFEVWGRSSLRHPFGLQRMEVIAGFAMSVLLIFTGFDLVSHNVKEALEGKGHEPHHPHKHGRVSAGAVDVTAVLALVSTLISAVGLKNHARIGKALHFTTTGNLPWVLSNPSHLLTLTCSTALLLLPLFSLQAYTWIDKALAATIAFSMCFLGVHLGKTVGSMLLMSYSGKGVSAVLHDIETDPLVTKIEEAKFWQAHYGVGIANLKLRVNGTEESLLKLRERIISLVRNRLSGGYGSGGQRWEVSVQFILDHIYPSGHLHNHSNHASHVHHSPVVTLTFANG